MLRRLLLVPAFVVAACAAQTTQMEACPAGGCVDPSASNGKLAPDDVLKKQATFDLQCDADKLSWTQIGNDTWYTEPRSWGVRGCGKQASYVIESKCTAGPGAPSGCNWLLNSSVRPAP